MKTLITICVLMAITLCLKAQTAAETLEWLNTKKIEVRYIYASAPQYARCKLFFTDKNVEAYDGENRGGFTKIAWSDVKDIKRTNNTIEIVPNEVFEGRPIYIRFDVFNPLGDKYFKALKHLAILKGAKLVNDDLF